MGILAIPRPGRPAPGIVLTASSASTRPGNASVVELAELLLDADDVIRGDGQVARGLGGVAIVGEDAAAQGEGFGVGGQRVVELAALLLDAGCKAASRTVMARPVRWTRSLWTAVRTRPVRADACNPMRLSRPRRLDQYGARAVWALPVTGSSGMP